MPKPEKLNLLSAHISKCLREIVLTLSAAETATVEASDTQSEDDYVSVSESSDDVDDLLLEVGDASNSDENRSKDSESEEGGDLSVGDRNRHGRRVGIWRFRYNS